jgi:hypothetical protein
LTKVEREHETIVRLCDVVGFQDLKRRENPSPAIGSTKQDFGGPREKKQRAWLCTSRF